MSAGRTPWAARAPAPGQQLNPQLFTGQLNQLAAAAALSGQAAFPAVANPQLQLQPGINLQGLPGLAQNLAQFNSQAQTVQQLNTATVARPQISQPVLVQQAQPQLPNQLQLHQQQQAVAAAQGALAATQTRNQRAFVGHVTKLQDNYGFVDDDVFFQTSVVKGALPRVGDRVMVEANFNANMPFKWNAFRIQLIPGDTPASQGPVVGGASSASSGGGGGGGSGGGGGGSTRTSDRWGPPTNTVQALASSLRDPPPSFGAHVTSSSRDRSPLTHRRRSPPPRRERTPPRRSPPPRRRSPSPRRHSSVNSKDSKERERPRSPKAPRRSSPDKSDRHTSATRDRSPAPKKRRVVPRYSVSLPKQALMRAEGGGVVDLRRRFASLYIPSDFFLSSPLWLSTFPMERPLSLDAAVGAHFHVMHKDVDCLSGEAESAVDPADADSRYVAKVMLLAGPGSAELLRRTVGVGGEEGRWDEEHEPSPLPKNLSFLVGLRGKSEVLAIGGAYSPSLDGPDPETNPRTLINTAIRTTKALTGIDLSACTQWYKFVELAYRRVDKGSGGGGVGVGAAEAVASFDSAPAASLVCTNASAALGPAKRLDRTLIFLPDIWSASPTKLEWERLCAQLKAQLAAKVAALDMPPPPTPEPTAPATPGTPDATTKDSAEDGGSSETGTVEKTAEELASGTATPWALLDVKAMKVADLRVELEARGLDVKGVKVVLSTRLQEALDKEMAEDEAKEEEEGAGNTTTDSTPNAANTTASSETSPANGEATTPSSAEKKEEKKETKELSEKEKAKAKEKEEKERKERKAALERHFGLSALEKATPGLLVHPNRTAKGGKFDCKLMSLASLLDYRVEDSKEHSFEVSLFAEMFSEMLARDGAFRIFKSLLAGPDREAERREKEAAEKAAKEAEEKEKKEAEEAAAATASAAAENGDAKEGEEEKKEEKKEEASSPKKDDSSAGKKRKRSKSPEKAVKEERMILVKDPGLLMAYAQFDANLCGYLYERDLEEILHFLGLGLSRAQASRLLKRLASRQDSVNYRKLTDTVVVEGSGDIRSQPSLLPIPPDADLVNGSLFRIPDDATSISPTSAMDTTKSDSSDGQVYFEGSLVDVAQLMAAKKRLEKEEKGMETRNAGLEKELKAAKDSIASLEKRKRRLEEDLDKCKRRMYDAEKCLKSSADDSVVLKSALNECKKAGERIAALVEKALPTPKDDSPPKKAKGGAAAATKAPKEEKEKKETPPTPTATKEVKAEDEVLAGAPDELTVKEELEEEAMEAETSAAAVATPNGEASAAEAAAATPATATATAPAAST